MKRDMSRGQAEALQAAEGHDPRAGGDAPVPAHVAVIMDGNGRWANRRGLPRVEGHRRGVEAVRGVVRSAIEAGVRYLTVYSFSSENWTRPASEIGELMRLLRVFIRSDLADLHKNGVRVRIIGERGGLSDDIRALLHEAETVTQGNRRLDLVVAFNYGGRQEIVAAIRKLAGAVAAGRMSIDAIDEKAVEAMLETAGIPDPDLLIRTSGEQRLSNFLPWQLAYTELVFTPVLWPDFDRAAFQACLDVYQQRERRFGGLGAGR
jgi:undecaprenyl diphosphate synthase